jgi:hypothetical protein
VVAAIAAADGIRHLHKMSIERRNAFFEEALIPQRSFNLS